MFKDKDDLNPEKALRLIPKNLISLNNSLLNKFKSPELKLKIFVTVFLKNGPPMPKAL